MINWRVFTARDTQLSHKYDPINQSDQAWIVKELGVQKLALCQQQEHGDNVAYVDKNYTSQVADALVTNIPQIALGIRTADCACVLLYSIDNSVIGAVHLGWRGAKSHLLYKTLQMMSLYSKSKIKAIIPPCIRQFSYEVSDEFCQNFTCEKPNSITFFTRKDYKLYFNLPGFVKDELISYGVSNIMDSNQNTYSSQEYFSYRRASHKGFIEERRILSCISI